MTYTVKTIKLQDCKSIIQNHYPEKTEAWVISQLSRAYNNTDLTPDSDFTCLLEGEFGIILNNKKAVNYGIF